MRGQTYGDYFRRAHPLCSTNGLHDTEETIEMTQQHAMNRQGRGFLGSVWHWLEERLASAAKLADEIFRQPPSGTANIGASGMRGLLALA
jgi:hypothetical protein